MPPKRKSSRKSRGRSNGQLRELNESIKTLTLVTADKSTPVQRDIQLMKMPKRPQICTFAIKVDKGFVSANLTGTNGTMSFTLSDTPTPTDFTSLFDQYRIQQVRVEFIPLSAPFGASTTATNLPYLITAIDYDDNSTTTAAALQQYSNAQVVYNQEYTQRTLTPRFALSAYSGVFGSFALAPVGEWIDAASPSVQYYGVKWATTPVSVVSGSYQLYAIVCTYMIQCRNNH